MPELTKNEILLALWGKFQVLYDFVQEMNERLRPAERPDFEGIILNAKLEIERVRQAYDMIKHDDPIPFPSEDQVRAFAEATGRLQQVVGINAAYEKLASAAIGLTKTWPLSQGG